MAAYVDTAGLAETVSSLNRAFPNHFTHTFAAKANTMSSALAQVRKLGMGCEVASPGELEQAIRAGFDPAEIVYDEPAKTRAVLEKVLKLGIGLNIDNFQEFRRVQEILKTGSSASRSIRSLFCPTPWDRISTPVSPCNAVSLTYHS